MMGIGTSALGAFLGGQANNLMGQAYSAQAAQEQAAYQNTLSSMYGQRSQACAVPKPHTRPEPKLRTREEILAQMEARLIEMEQQADAKAKAELTACAKCRWYDGSWCKQPLIIGIDAKVQLAVDCYEGGANKLCGPEKALWEPRLSLWARFWNWFYAPWMETP